MSYTIPKEIFRVAAPSLTVRAPVERRGSTAAGRPLVWDATPQRRRGEAFAVVKQRLSW